MRSIHVHTAAFPTAPEGDLEFCNGQPGSAFVEWLAQQLAAQGMAAGKAIQEDYGWGCWLDQDGCSIWVCVSYVGGDGADADADADANPASEAEWVVSVAHDFPFFAFRQWFRRRAGAAAVARVADIVRAALAARDDVRTSAG
ncbi:MAG: hypothetical protein AB7K09_06550 [Planctomycetota bacterium]